MTRLNRLSIPANENHIYTCADTKANYLAKQKPDSTAYVIGEGDLLTAFTRTRLFSRRQRTLLCCRWRVSHIQC